MISVRGGWHFELAQRKHVMESQQGSWLLPAHEGAVASQDSEEQVSEHRHSVKSQLESLHGVWILETADTVTKPIAPQLLFHFHLLS